MIIHDAKGLVRQARRDRAWAVAPMNLVDERAVICAGAGDGAGAADTGAAGADQVGDRLRVKTSVALRCDSSVETELRSAVVKDGCSLQVRLIFHYSSIYL